MIRRTESATTAVGERGARQRLDRAERRQAAQINADSLDEAVAVAKDCPIFLGPNPAKVDVYETIQAM